MKDNAAMYLRLSRDDGNGKQESDSIESQRLVLRQYAEIHNIHVITEFIDDGLSGIRWDRSGLQDLLTAIEDGWIQIVLVKDLSRLSRDYIRTGELLEHWFPEHNVQLIAVNDGVNTGLHSASNDFSPIRAVMDDWYARDISRKVRAAIYARQKAGYCTAATLPYGYFRQNERIEIHLQQAEVVRTIYSVYRIQKSCRGVVRYLNDHHIPPPKKNSWSDASILRMLQNPAYIGKLHLHKTQKISYKSNKKTYLSESDAIVYAIPAIVSENEFETVQKLLRLRTHRANEPHWLSGKVYCGNCFSRMTVSVQNDTYRLLCGGRRRKNGCDNPSLRVDTLIDQLCSALTQDGISIDACMLPHIIERISVTSARITVKVRYRKPDCTSSDIEKRQICVNLPKDSGKS